MTNVLITGATGNVGMEVLSALSKLKHHLTIYAGVRDLNVDKDKLSGLCVQFSQFDFADITTYETALYGSDILFLLRPPQISAVEKYFKPLIDTCKEKRVKHIIFLSVQGVEKSKIIPHHKIEQLIVDSKIPFTFLRPAYFMQNFTTILRKDLINDRRIYLPAGQAKFTLVDVCDIGAVAANIMSNISLHMNKSYELTNKEKLTFSEMASILSKNLGIQIQYKSPSLLSFFFVKRKEKLPTMFILVMIMLHYFPRFQQEPQVTEWVENIINRQPEALEEFINKHKLMLTEW